MINPTLTVAISDGELKSLNYYFHIRLLVFWATLFTMVTGVETAGLVLAVSPIILDRLEYYINAVSGMEGMRNYEVVLKQLEREVKAEMTIFKNSWNRLLQLAGENLISGTTRTSNSKTTQLSPLDPDSISSIVDLCEELIDILEELKRKFEKYERTTVCSSSGSAHIPGIDSTCCLGRILKDATRRLQSYQRIPQ